MLKRDWRSWGLEGERSREGIPGEGRSPGKGRAGTAKESPLELAGSCLGWWAEEKWPLAVSSVTCQGRAAQDGHTAASHSSEIEG